MIAVLLAVILMALNAWATRAVLRDDLSATGQRIAQVTLVWLLPVVGALLVLHLTRRDMERPSGRYPNDPEYVDDFGVSAQGFRDLRDASHAATSHASDDGGGH
jgi:hypothetical protein